MGRLPDFIIIGAAKAGTTSLYEYLVRHPSLCMSNPKEPEFFAREDVYARGQHWYESLFAQARPDQRVGEASTLYTRSPDAVHVPDRMKRMLPDVKLIYMLRNPVQRAYSYYVQLVKNRQNASGSAPPARTFEEFLFPEQYPSRASRERFFAPFDSHIPDEPETLLGGGRYADMISLYARHFDQRNMLILLFDDFVQRPEWLLRQVFDFLDVEDHAKECIDAVPGAANVTSSHFLGLRHRVIGERLGSAPLLQSVKRVVPKSIRRGVVGMLAASGVGERVESRLEPKGMERETKSYLIDYYEPQVRSVEQILDRDLSHWLR